MITALAAAAVAALRQPPTAAGALATEQAWVAALARHDTAALDRLFAPDFVHITWRGQVQSRQETLDGAARGAARTNALSALSAATYGDTALVRGVNTARGPDGALIGRVRFTDVFVYREGAWRAVSAQETVIADPAPN